MKARTRARRRALEVLYEAEIRREAILDVLQWRTGDPDYPMKPYARDLITGVAEHQEEIDELIITYAVGWTIERMPVVDRALLRIAFWEMLYNPEVDDPVAIKEAVFLAETFSTAGSPRFINGLLDRIRSLKPMLGWE